MISSNHCLLLAKSSTTPKDKMEDLKNVKYDDLGSMFEEIKRQAETALLDVGKCAHAHITQILDTVGPMLSGLFDGIGQLLKELQLN